MTASVVGLKTVTIAKIAPKNGKPQTARDIAGNVGKGVFWMFICRQTCISLRVGGGGNVCVCVYVNAPVPLDKIETFNYTYYTVAHKCNMRQLHSGMRIMTLRFC